ncbi:MAG TPA: hypothetical protein VGP82_12820, partial [Ktedonobacterales bacterium]|nr:hypothetical protein [Ktedonobacterales bacterium]
DTLYSETAASMMGVSIMGTDPGNSLSIIDAPEWHHESGFSEAFVGDLIEADRYLKSADSDPDAYLYAAVSVWPYRSRRLSVHQRLQLEFVLAQAFAGENDLTQALDHLEASADIADFLDEPGTAATIGYEAGRAYHSLSEFTIARDCYRDALTLQRSLETHAGPADAARESELLRRIAGLDCELADFAHADIAIREAHHLLHTYRTSRNPAADSATLDWIAALIAHWTGRPEDALPLATTMVATYTRLGLGQMAGRANSLAAEIALDLTGDFSFENHPDLRAAFADKAEPYAEAAIKFAAAANDAIGVQLGLLALQRCLRMRGPTLNGIEVIEGVLHVAKRLGDTALLGRAQLALGEELAAQGRWDSARQYYSMARHIFEESEMLALLIWPNRRLFGPDEP